MNNFVEESNDNWYRSAEFDKLNSENKELKEEIKNLKLQKRKSLYDYHTFEQENSELRSQVEELRAHLDEMDVANKSLRFILQKSQYSDETTELSDLEIRNELLRMQVKRKQHFRQSIGRSFGTLTSSRIADAPLVPIRIVVPKSKYQ